MNVIQKLSLMLLCLLSSSTMFSFIRSYARLQKGDKEVFLLGDTHVVCKLDRQERDTFLSYLLAADKYTKPVAFIAEANLSYCQHFIDNDLDVTLDTDPMLEYVRNAYTAHTELFSSEKLHFWYGDCRNDTLLKCCQERQGKDFISEEYIDEIISVIQRVINYFEVIGEGEEKGSIPDETVFQRDHMPAILADLKLIVSSKKCTYEQFDLVTNLAFYIAMQSALVEDDKAILYAGEAHTEKIQKILISDGYELVEHKNYKDEANLEVGFEKAFGSYFIDQSYFDTSMLTQEMNLAMFGCYLNLEQQKEIIDTFTIDSSSWLVAVTGAAFLWGASVLLSDATMER